MPMMMAKSAPMGNAATDVLDMAAPMERIETPQAEVVEGETMTEDELKDFVRKNMAKHKIPRYVDFVDSFPMNAAGKILKYKMREAAVEKFGLQAANSIVTA